MISASSVYAVSAAVYAVTFLGLLLGLRRVPASKRIYCYPVVGVVGLAATTIGSLAAGFGILTIGGGELDLPRVINDAIAYPILWMLAALLADTGRRTLAVAGAVAVTQVLAFNVASLLGGIVGLAGLLVVVAGHGLFAYLFLRPIWRRAQQVPDDQRLLHWKARNLLLFLIGMLIAFSVLTVTGIFDQFVMVVLSEYVAVLIRVGFAGFLFVNLDAIVTESNADTDSITATVDPIAGSD